MTSHHLRHLKDLLHRTVSSEDGALGRLAGIAFDSVAWKVDHVIVSDPQQSREPLIVPVQFFRSIDDERRQLHFDVAGKVLLSAGSYGSGNVEGLPLFDAAGLLGRTLYGRDEPAGKIHDLLVNVDSWKLRYLVVQTGAGQVLTDVEWCSALDRDGRLTIDLPAAAVAAAPPYPGLEALSSGYEEMLYRHYTSRKYATDGSRA